jgi:putative glutamine amidotransferase
MDMNQQPRPLIGLTSYGLNEQKRYHLPATYVNAVRRAGGIPVLLPPGEEFVADLIPRLDGVIITGGGDVDPEYYNGPANDKVYGIDRQRDELELAVARQIRESGTPTLAICRGLQVVNVAYGGTLIQHLPDVVGEAIQHQDKPGGPLIHPVRLSTGTRLVSILGDDVSYGASSHHQAIDVLAPGLEVIGQADDGTIEAVELPGHPWLLALQWHPEMTASEDEKQQRIFDAFVAAAAERLRQAQPVD